MKKRITILSVLALPFFIMATMPERSSSGAPASHTGAPGEATCGVSGCHDDKALNSGTAALSIQVGNSLTHYTPGQTYQVKVKITDANVDRFGFQLLAMFSGDTANAGTFQITDPARTQIVSNYASLQSRRYVTYSFKGTDAVNLGLGEWTFNWTAPATNLGPVTFYAGGVSANDDMGDKGDYVYTTNVTLAGN